MLSPLKIAINSSISPPCKHLSEWFENLLYSALQGLLALCFTHINYFDGGDFGALIICNHQTEEETHQDVVTTEVGMLVVS